VNPEDSGFHIRHLGSVSDLGNEMGTSGPVQKLLEFPGKYMVPWFKPFQAGPV
jgi:hypothetical protein